MEQNNHKFRLRLNLFDGIILVLALAVGALLLWTALKPDTPAEGSTSAAATVRYTVRFQRWPAGNSGMIEAGDTLVDNIKNYELGKVLSYEVVPATMRALDQDSRRYVQAAIEGYEDILVTVEAPCTVNEKGFLLDGGYALRVGLVTYIKGEGYMASGPVISIEREGQA